MLEIPTYSLISPNWLLARNLKHNLEKQFKSSRIQVLLNPMLMFHTLIFIFFLQEKHSLLIPYMIGNAIMIIGYALFSVIVSLPNFAVAIFYIACLSK